MTRGTTREAPPRHLLAAKCPAASCIRSFFFFFFFFHVLFISSREPTTTGRKPASVLSTRRGCKCKPGRSRRAIELTMTRKPQHLNEALPRSGYPLGASAPRGKDPINICRTDCCFEIFAARQRTSCRRCRHRHAAHDLIGRSKLLRFLNDNALRNASDSRASRSAERQKSDKLVMPSRL